MNLFKSYPSQLGKYIQYFYSLKAEVSELPKCAHRHLPDGTLELIINLGDPVMQSSDGKSWQKRPDSSIIGLFSEKNFVRYQGKLHLVGAIFCPGFAHLFLNDSLEHFKKCMVPAEYVYDNSLNLLYEQMNSTGDEKKRHEFMESYLLRFLHKRTDERTVNAITQSAVSIREKGGNVNVFSLHKNFCMSERNFRRKFKEYIGISPKHYSRIIRIKSFIKQYKHCKPSYFDRLFELGYTDQAHLINDFKKIAGITPTAFISQLNPVDNLYLRSGTIKNSKRHF